MPDQLTKTVVLVGMMGAGKTAVGTALARQLDVPFADMDAEIEKAAAMKVAEIFARDGETFFRQRETAVLERLLGGPVQVLSTGGGVFTVPGNRTLIGAHGVSVWLNADLDLLWNRVRHKTTRPLLQTDNPKQTLSDLYTARRDIYAMADLVVDAAPDLSIEDMATKVHAVLAQAGIVIEEGAHAR